MDASGNQAGATPEWGVEVPPPPPATPTCVIDTLSVSPIAPQPVGTTVSITASASCTNGVQSLRFKIDGNELQTVLQASATITWDTSTFSAIDHVITVEAADSVGGYIQTRSQTYTLLPANVPTPTSPPIPYGPNISQVNFNPASATVGDNVGIHIKVDSSNPGAIRIYIPCGQVDHFEHTVPEYDTFWHTSGCGAGEQTIRVCARDVLDNNWVNPNCTERGYTLNAPPPPPTSVPPLPSGTFWADNTTIQQGQCTTLHWQTTDATSVYIDGVPVATQGEMQVCPPITKHYQLKFSGPGGQATRELSIVVNTLPSLPFATGDVIQIGPDIFVIIDGQRRLVPNPETLDALGLSRSLIDNKGWSDSQLSSIPRGPDVPDVNRDPSGFTAFKNQYFPNTTPITPNPTSTPIPPSRTPTPSPNPTNPPTTTSTQLPTQAVTTIPTLRATPSRTLMPRLATRTPTNTRTSTPTRTRTPTKTPTNTRTPTPTSLPGDDQPVEWESNPGSLRFSLTSIGQGWLVRGDECDRNDYVMQVNLNSRYDPDRFRIYSINAKVQRGFANKSPIGHNLTTLRPYLCLGLRDTWSSGGPLPVAANMFVWVK